MYWSLSDDMNIQNDMILLHDIFRNPTKYIINIPTENVSKTIDLITNLPNLII